jgi:hypothetical protein
MVQAEATADFRGERSKGIAAIAAGGAVAAALWYGLQWALPPIGGMESLAARMLFTLKCFCGATLFALVMGVEAVAHERLSSPAFDPLAGYETRRLRVNQRYLQNTLEQTVVFAAALFGLAAYCPTGAAMRAVAATAVVWMLARYAFWIGYHRSAALRGLGAPGMAISMIVLVYVVAHFGGELAGRGGAGAVVVLFLAIEAALFWLTRPKAGAP